MTSELTKPVSAHCYRRPARERYEATGFDLTGRPDSAKLPESGPGSVDALNPEPESL